MPEENVKILDHLIGINQDLNQFIQKAGRHFNANDMGTIQALNRLLNNTTTRDAQMRAHLARLKKNDE